MGAPMDVPTPLCQLVYLSFLSAAVGSLPDRVLGGPPYDLRMESHNFQHVLSWQAKNDSAVPATYNVLYTDRRSWRTARQCSGITQLSCDLTEDFKQRSTEYSTFVQRVIGTKVFNSSMLRFQPLSQTFLGPPEVNITPCLNCINVTIKLPTSHFRENEKLLSLIDIYQKLEYQITVKSQDGEHKRPREKITKEVFSTVIEELYPNRNYCVSAVVTASLNKRSIPSAWKCVPADSGARPGYHMVAVAGAVCVSLIIAGALKCMHAAGYFLQDESLPQALASIRRCVFPPWIPAWEAADSVEIIPREVKHRPGGGSDSEDSSDTEDSSDSEDSDNNDHYTRREVLGRAPPVPPGTLGQYSVSSPCRDSSSQAGDIPTAEPPGPEEHGGDPEGDTDTTGSESPSPSPEGSCTYPQTPSSSACFTINLGSVLLGSLEGDRDSPAPAGPAQEEHGDWQCAHAWEAQDDTESLQKPLCRSDFQEWENSSPSSEESDSSEADLDQVTGYMRR